MMASWLGMTWSPGNRYLEEEEGGMGEERGRKGGERGRKGGKRGEREGRGTLNT